MIPLSDPTIAGFFQRHRYPRARDMQEVLDGINRAGRITGSGRAFTTSGSNPAVHVPSVLPIIKGFWARISIPSGGDYTDERYLIYRLRATGGDAMTDQIATEDDTPPDNSDGELNEPAWPLTATNRAEKSAHSHALGDGVEVWVTAEWDYKDVPVLHYSFGLSPPGGIAVHDCADAGGPATIEKFAGGFTVAFAGSQANVAPNIIADPAHPGIIITNGNGATCGPIKLGVDLPTCLNPVTSCVYSGGVFRQYFCDGSSSIVFSTTACPTPAGAPSAEFFAYNG